MTMYITSNGYNKFKEGKWKKYASVMKKILIKNQIKMIEDTGNKGWRDLFFFVLC